MKLWQGALFGFALVIIAVGVVWLFDPMGATYTPSETIQTSIPTYTAYQVIAVVQSVYEGCYRGTALDDRQYIDPLITVTYIGGTQGVWKAVIKCPTGYRMNSYSQMTVYFWESDSSIHE